MFPAKFLVIIGIVICLLVCYYFYDEINSTKKLAAQTHQKLAALENKGDVIEKEVGVLQRKTEALSRWQAGEDIHSPPMTISFNSDMVPNGDLSVRYVNISDPEAVKMMSKINGRPEMLGKINGRPEMLGNVNCRVPKMQEGKGVPAVLPTIIQPSHMPAFTSRLAAPSIPIPMPFTRPQQSVPSRSSMFAPAVTASKPTSPQRPQSQSQYQSQPLTPSRYSVPRDELSDFGSEQPRRSPRATIASKHGSPSDLPRPYTMLTSATEGSELGHILSGLDNDISNLDTSDFDMELDQRAVRNISEAVRHSHSHSHSHSHESDAPRPQSRSKPSRK